MKGQGRHEKGWAMKLRTMYFFAKEISQANPEAGSCHFLTVIRSSADERGNARPF
jgi:hypothetical protein